MCVSVKADSGTGTFFVIDSSFIWEEFPADLNSNDVYVIYSATKKLHETGPRDLLNPPIDKNIIYYYWFIQFGWTMTIALHRTYSPDVWVTPDHTLILKVLSMWQNRKIQLIEQYTGKPFGRCRHFRSDFIKIYYVF